MMGHREAHGEHQWPPLQTPSSSSLGAPGDLGKGSVWEFDRLTWELASGYV